MAPEGNEPRLSGQRPTQYQWTNRAVHYRPRIKSQKTARLAVGVEPTTFRKAATDDDIKTSVSTETATTAYLFMCSNGYMNRQYFAVSIYLVSNLDQTFNKYKTDTCTVCVVVNSEVTDSDAETQVRLRDDEVKPKPSQRTAKEVSKDDDATLERSRPHHRKHGGHSSDDDSEGRHTPSKHRDHGQRSADNRFAKPSPNKPVSKSPKPSGRSTALGRDPI